MLRSGDRREGAMSFIKKAQEAAQAAATQAQQAAETAKQKAQEAATSANRSAADPATTERINKTLTGASQSAREAVGMARRGVNTVIERIDPGTLAELIVKATALQEMTNKSLRSKGSPYRISEISIAATIPPGVTFAIGRLDDEPEAMGDTVIASSELIAADEGDGELVISLDGSTIDDATASAIAEAAAVPGAMPPSSVERS